MNTHYFFYFLQKTHKSLFMCLCVFWVPELAFVLCVCVCVFETQIREYLRTLSLTPWPLTPYPSKLNSTQVHPNQWKSMKIFEKNLWKSTKQLLRELKPEKTFFYSSFDSRSTTYIHISSGRVCVCVFETQILPILFKRFLLFSFALVCFFKPEHCTEFAALVFLTFSLKDFFLFSFAFAS